MAGSTGGAVAQRGRTRPAVGGSAALLGRSTARGSAGGGRAAHAAGGRRVEGRGEERVRVRGGRRIYS